MAYKSDIVPFGKETQQWVKGFKRGSESDKWKDKATRWGKFGLRFWMANKLQEHELHVDKTRLDNSIALGIAHADVIKAKEQYDLRRPWMDKIEGEGFSVSDPAADYLYDEEAWKRARRANKVFNSAHPEGYLDYASFDKAHRAGEISEGLYDSMSNLYKAEKDDLIQFVRSGKKFDPVRQNAYLTQLTNMGIDVGKPTLFNLVTGHTRRRVDLQDQAIDAFRDDFISKPVQNTLNDFALWEESRDDIQGFRKAAEDTPPSGLDLIPNSYLEILAMGDKRSRDTVKDHITTVMEVHSKNNNGEVMPQRLIEQEFRTIVYGIGNPGEGTKVLYENYQGQRNSLIAKFTRELEPGEALPEEDEMKLTKGLKELDAVYKATIGKVNHLDRVTSQKWITQRTEYGDIITKLEEQIKNAPPEDIRGVQGELEFAEMLYNRAPGMTTQDMTFKLEFMKTLETRRNEDMARQTFSQVAANNFTPGRNNIASSTYHFKNNGLNPDLDVYKNWNIHEWTPHWEQSESQRIAYAADTQMQIEQLVQKGVPTQEGFIQAYTPYYGTQAPLQTKDANRQDKLASAAVNIRNIVNTNNTFDSRIGTQPYLGGIISYEDALQAVIQQWPTQINANNDPELEYLEVRQIEDFLYNHLREMRFGLTPTKIKGFYSGESREYPGTPTQVIAFEGITSKVKTMPEQLANSGLSDDEINGQVRDGRNKITNAINESLEEAEKTVDPRVIAEFNATIQEKYGDGAFLLLPGTREWDAAVAPGMESDVFAGDREDWIEFDDATGRYKTFETAIAAERSSLSEEELSRLIEEDQRLSAIIDPLIEETGTASMEDLGRRASIRQVMEYSRDLYKAEQELTERGIRGEGRYRGRKERKVETLKNNINELYNQVPWLEDLTIGTEKERVTPSVGAGTEVSSIDNDLATVANIFNDPQEARDLMREVAMVESNMGQDSGAYDVSTGLTGQKGSLGIAQIDEIAFDEVQRRIAAGNRMEKWVEPIKAATGTDIREVEYEDLTQDDLNLIFARLYFMISPRSIPKTVEGRARLWKDIYNTSAGKGTVERYIDVVSESTR